MVRPTTLSWLSYGWETTYGTAATTIDKAFGHGVRVTNLTRRNNIEKIFSCGYRNAQKLVAKKFEGAITMEWVLANPWFFKGVMGGSSSTGTDPTTHTFSEADSIEGVTISNNVSMASDAMINLLGSKFATTTITAAVNELIRVRADLPYVNEAKTTTTSSKVADSFDLFTFAHGSLELPNGTTLAMVQNAEVTIANTPEIVLGLGSRLGQDQPVKNREYSGTITMALQASADLLEKCYGSATGPSALSVSEQATMELVFTNGLTSSSKRSINMLFTGVQLDEESMPQDPTAIIMEDVSVVMRSLSVTADNATAAVV